MTFSQTGRTIDSVEQRYHHLFEFIPVCVFLIDLAETPPAILEANRRAGLVYGYTSTELVGKPVRDVIGEASAVEEIIRRVRQGETVTAETTNRRRDGTTFPMRVVASLDPNNAGWMIAAVEDISAEIQRRGETEAIAAERQRIAREIHDGVAQNLAGLRLKSALWRHQAEGGPPGMRAALEEMLAVLNDSIVDLRRVIYALRPADLEVLGFFGALERFITDFGDQNQILAIFEAPKQSDFLPKEYELPLFRLIQESLNNIGRHARASGAAVRLAIDADGRVNLWVSDNGQGFDPTQVNPADPAGHFGLLQMRERVVELGGKMEIYSATGKGTDIFITLPPVPKSDGG